MALNTGSRLKIYIVNLSDSKVRRRHMVKQMTATGIPYTFVTAVSSSCISNSQLKLANSGSVRGGVLGKGEVACTLSHLKACEALSNDTDIDIGIILEDDLIVNRELSTLVINAFNNCTDMDMLLLYAQAFRPLKLCVKARIDKNYTISTTNSLPNLWGTQGYAIKRQNAMKLGNSLRLLQSRADDWLFHNKHGLESIAILYPFPILHAEFNSDINISGYSEALVSKASKLVFRYRITPFYQILLALRRWRVEKRQKRNIHLDRRVTTNRTYRI